MSRWIMPRECRCANAVNRSRIIVIAWFLCRLLRRSRLSRSSGWKGNTSKKEDEEGRLCVSSNSITFGCFARVRIRASRFGLCGGRQVDGAVSLIASFFDPDGVGWIVLYIVEKRPVA